VACTGYGRGRRGVAGGPSDRGDVVVGDSSATVLNDYLIPEKDPAFDEIQGNLLIPKDLKDNINSVINYLNEAKKIIEENDWEKILEKNDENKLWIYAGQEGRGKVLLPIRVALSGKDKSVDLFDIMKVVGKETILRRIEKAVKVLNIPKKDLNTQTQSRTESRFESQSKTFTSSN